MTALDHLEHPAGYFASAWPGEAGGPRRQKVAGTPGPAIGPEEQLVSTSRDTGGWAVMFVQRDAGELYLQCGSGLRRGESAPAFRDDESSATGWIERVDPVTLATLARSPDLPSGGWLWCGSAAVHANGDIYVVNGRYAHRLDPECRVLAECRLPVDAPYNGLLVMADGNIVTRNLGFRDGDHARFAVLEPERLAIIDEFTFPDRCMGRFSADGDHLYFTTPTTVRRLRYAAGMLALDEAWQASYAVDDAQSDAWDTALGAGSVWMMDMGRPPGWMGPGTSVQRAFRFDVDDPSRRDVIDVIGLPGAWNPGPPLYDPRRRILVHYDSVNATVVAQHDGGSGSLEELWRKPYRNFVQMMVWADTGELVLEDSPSPGFDTSGPSGDLVVVDITTGEERGRAPMGSPMTAGMFLCPGWDRDFYAATLPGVITRVAVRSTPAP